MGPLGLEIFYLIWLLISGHFKEVASFQVRIKAYTTLARKKKSHQ